MEVEKPPRKYSFDTEDLIRALERHLEAVLGPDAPHLDRDTLTWIPGASRPGEKYEGSALYVLERAPSPEVVGDPKTVDQVWADRARDRGFCGEPNPTGPGLLCDREAGHVGPHGDQRGNQYGSGSTRATCGDPNPVRPGLHCNQVAGHSWSADVCGLERGHTGVHRDPVSRQEWSTPELRPDDVECGSTPSPTGAGDEHPCRLPSGHAGSHSDGGRSWPTEACGFEAYAGGRQVQCQLPKGHALPHGQAQMADECGGRYSGADQKLSWGEHLVCRRPPGHSGVHQTVRGEWFSFADGEARRSISGPGRGDLVCRLPAGHGSAHQTVGGVIFAHADGEAQRGESKPGPGDDSDPHWK